MQEVGEVIRYGTKRHGPRNWETRDASDADYLSAAFRHLIAYANGTKADAESGLHHLAHAVANCLFMIHHDTPSHAEWNRTLSRAEHDRIAPTKAE